MDHLPPHLRLLQSPSTQASKDDPPSDSDRSASQPKKTAAVGTSNERPGQPASVSGDSTSALSDVSVSSGVRLSTAARRTALSDAAKMDQSPLEAELDQLPGYQNVLQPTSTHRTLSPPPVVASKPAYLPPHLRPFGDSAASVTSTSSVFETPTVGKHNDVSIATGKSIIMDQPVLPHHRAYAASAHSVSSYTSTASDRTELGIVPISEIAKGKARVMDQPAFAQKPVKLRTGDAAEWTQQTEAPLKMGKAYPCPWETCALGFETLKLLKKHKLDRHDYCKKCDLDFNDFQHHLDHKIGSPNHITCPVCGEDFKSSGGRDAHIRAMHPNPQDINCPGCGEKFIRAGSLIDHIEKNTCKNITIDQFQRYRAVHAIREATISTLRTEFAEDEDCPVVEDAESVTDTISGGVTLEPEEDHLGPGEDEVQFKYPTLAPNIVPTVQRPGPGGPRPQPVSVQAAPLKGFSYADKAKANLPPAIPIAAPPTATKPKNVPHILMDSPPGEMKFPAWTRPGPDAKMLFPASMPRDISANRPRDVQEIMTRMLVGQERPSPGLRFLNGQSVEAINPASKEFNPDGFIDPLGRWKCPYPGCGKVFPVRTGFVAHLNSPAHKGIDHRCPECLKMFKSATAITQHMEATGSKCKIRDSKNYGKIVGLVSGGIIAVEGQHVDGTVRYEVAEPEW